MQPSTPHQTIASFLVWTADDLSETAEASDGPRGRRPEVSPLGPRRLVMGHGSRYARGPGTLGSAVLAHFCSLGFHTSGSHFNMPVSVITEARMSTSFCGPRRPALPPRSLIFRRFSDVDFALKSRKPLAVTNGRARGSRVNRTAGNGPVRCQTCHFSWCMARMCWAMGHRVEETVKVISDRPCR